MERLFAGLLAGLLTLFGLVAAAGGVDILNRRKCFLSFGSVKSVQRKEVAKRRGELGILVLMR